MTYEEYVDKNFTDISFDDGVTWEKAIVLPKSMPTSYSHTPKGLNVLPPPSAEL